MKSITDDFIWQAEYMQKPIESKALLFNPDELNYFEMKDLRRDKFGHVICAATVGVTDTADEGTDFLAALSAKVIGEYCYITNVVFTQDPIEITEPAVANLIMDTHMSKMQVESNFGGKSFAKNVKRLITGQSRCSVSWQANSTNKETRILMKSSIVKKYMYFRNDYKAGSDYDKFMNWLWSYARLGKNEHDDAPDAVTMLAELVYEKKELKAVPKP